MFFNYLCSSNVCDPEDAGAWYVIQDTSTIIYILLTRSHPFLGRPLRGDVIGISTVKLNAGTVSNAGNLHDGDYETVYDLNASTGSQM